MLHVERTRRRHIERLKTLTLLGRLMASTTESRKVCDAIAEAGVTLVGAKIAHVWVNSPSDRLLRLEGSFGGPESADRLLDHSTVPHGSGLPGRILEDGRPEYLEDAQADPRWMNRRFIRELGLHGYVGLPLIARSQPVGVLSLLFIEARAFGRSDREFMEALANHAAIAIQTARLAAAERATHEEAERARVEAERANRAKDDFLAVLSHEIRTPLNAMLGWLYLLRKGKLDPAGVEHALDVLERNVRTQSRLVDDLLDISRIVAGKLTTERQSLRLVSIVQAEIDAIRPTAEAQGVRLAFRAIEDTVVEGDAVRLRQAVSNLISNAVKFTPAGGHVDVELDRDGADARLVVRDDGLGISPDVLPFVFDRFRQADSSTSRPLDGLGLGLAIVRHLVELHGGRVTAASEGPGRGSTFTIALPATEVEPESIVRAATVEDRSPRAEACSLQGISALVIDDDEETCELMARILDEAGAEVATAPDTTIGLSLVQSLRPDVIVCDLAMPGTDGYAFVDALRQLSATDGGKTPALAVTAHARPEDRGRALDRGFNQYLSKPVEPAALVSALGQLLGRL